MHINDFLQTKKKKVVKSVFIYKKLNKINPQHKQIESNQTMKLAKKLFILDYPTRRLDFSLINK